MGRKIASIVCLWLALAAMVLFYTEKDTYLWRYAGEDLDAFVVSSAERAALEDAYAKAMAMEQAAAAERTAQGIWGTEEDDSPIIFYDTLPAREADRLNLMWGTYEAEVTYRSQEALLVAFFAPGRQSFLRDAEALLPEGEGTVAFRFTLTDSAEGLRLACDLPEGAELEEVTVRKRFALPFSPDLAVYAGIAGAVLTLLLILSWDHSPEGAQRRRDALILVATALFASMPLLWDGLQEGHDLLFHLNRIEGIAAGLRSGQFPVRIHASTLLGYGYASSVFYPETFLYVPALLRLMGVSLLDALRGFELTINLLCAFIAYRCAHRLLGKRKLALGAALLYTLSIYRLVNLYVRATLGESLAMMFFPLLILAMVEVLARDARRWPLLALAMTGILNCHLLSAMFAAAFCFAGALLCWKRLVREPKRILAILAAAGITALCSAGFMLPLLEYTREGISTSVMLDASQNVLKLGSFLVVLSGNNGTIAPEREDFAYTIGVVPGLAAMAGFALFLTRRYALGRGAHEEGEEARIDRLCTALSVLCALALLGATEAFPWRHVINLPEPYSSLFRQIQFPWRLVSVAVPMLSLVAARGFCASREGARGGMIALAVLAVLTAGYTMQCFVQDEPVLQRTSFVDTRIGQYEYTYVGTEKEALAAGQVILDGAEHFTVSEWAKQGTNLSFVIDEPEGGRYLELPLLYYPGYHAARADREGEIAVRRGNNNRIRLYAVEAGLHTRIDVWFAEPLRWRIAEAVSLAGVLALLAALVRGKRRWSR